MRGVGQIGYELASGAARAYLMSTAAEPQAKFKVVNASGETTYSANIGPLLGTWSHSQNLVYRVYALDFPAAARGSSAISVSGRAPATSAPFPVDNRDALYDGLLLNTKFFYETECDGPSTFRTPCAALPAT